MRRGVPPKLSAPVTIEVGKSLVAEEKWGSEFL